MNILLIGDIVGKPGKTIVQRALAGLRAEAALDLVIANAENIAGGSGITPKIYRELLAAGVDCVTMGDHIYRRSEIDSILEGHHAIVKPANFPRSAPGRDWVVVPAANGVPVAVFSLLGRLFMRPVDCPWTRADEVLQEIPAEVVVRVLDFHAEATSEKQLMGRYLDGRVSAVLGTHTHVPTADEQLFPGGTAFQCDVGMTGPCESILGRDIDRVMRTTITFRPTYFQVARNDVRLGGTLVEIDPVSGRALGIRRILLTENDTARLETLRPPSMPPATADEDDQWA
ncbi:MAG: TIGR00282 family metallophosphoesterase [Pirellulaceae bacterium]